MAVANKPFKIGKYDVVEMLGEGGMGAVYKAVDPRIGRSVAIKVIKGDFAQDPELLRRFDIEARAVGNLQHPNIVAVYEFGEENGSPYLVMQYLDGTALDKVIAQRQNLGVIQKLDIIIGVLRALDYAHEHGVIHRDVKPANVHMLKDGSVKLLDFGIAREGNLSQTKTGQVMGTMFYMPPEQMSGEVVDRRGDIFSTGIMLFELLTYSLPFEARDQTSIIVQRLKGDPPPPLSKYFDNYPLELDDIIAHAMMRDREERYSRAEEFAFDLTRVQERLKRDKASHYVDQARALIAKSDWSEAKKVLSEVVRIDTQNSTARQLLYEVQKSLQAQQRVERVQQLRTQAEEALAAKQLQNAADLVEQAIKIDKNDLHLLDLREKIQEAKARAAQILKLLKLAGAAQQSEQFEVAEKAAADALALDASDTDAKVMQAAIARQLVEQEKQNRVKQLLQVARREVSARQFETARENIDKAKAIDPAHPEIPGLEKMVIAGQQQERRHVELQQVCAEIEQRLVDNNLAAARDLAGNSLRKFPGEERLIRLKAAADEAYELEERRLYIEQQVISASRLVDDGQASSALKLLQDAERLYPGNTRLLQYMRVVREAVVREVAEHEKEGILIRAGAAIRRKSLIEAIDTLERGLLQFPADVEIRGLLETTREELERENQRKRVDEVSQQARQLLETRAHTDAISLLERSVAQVSNPDLIRLLEYARKQAADYRAGMKQVSEQASQMLDDGRHSEALKFLETQVETYGKNAEFQALLNQTRAQVERALQARQRLLRYVEQARSLLRSGNLPEAETIANRCHLEAPSEPEVIALAIEIDEERKAVDRRRQEEAKRRDREMQQRAAEAERATRAEDDARTKIFPRGTKTQFPPAPEPELPPVGGISSSSIGTGSQGREPTEWLSRANPQVTERPPTIEEHGPAQVEEPAEPVVRFPPSGDIGPGREIQPPPEPGKSKRVMLIAIVAILVLIAGAVVWIVSHSSKPTEAYLKINGAPAGASYRVGDKTGFVGSDGTATIRVTPGATTLELDATGYEHYSKSGMELKAGETANVSPVMAKTPEPIKPVLMGTLVIKSKSQSADVWVNGKYQDQTAKDGKFTIQLPPDEYEVELKKNGFEDSPVQRVEIVAGTTKDVTFSPLKKSESALQASAEASLVVKSEPGARVRVDGTDRGGIQANRQLGLKVQVGKRDIEVSMPGREAYRKLITASADQRVVVEATLRPLPTPTPPASTSLPTPTPTPPPPPPTTPPPATLILRAPAGALVRVDDQSLQVQSTAPLEIPVVPGDHSVEVTMEGYKSWSRRQTFASGSRVELTPELAKLATQPLVPPIPTPSEVSPNADDDLRIRDLLKAYVGAMQDKDVALVRHLYPNITDKERSGLTGAFHDADSIQMSLDDCKHDPILGRTEVEVTCRQTFRVRAGGVFQAPRVNTALFTLRKFKTGDWVIYKASVR